MGIIKWFAYRLRKNKLVEKWTSGIPDMILPIVRVAYPSTIIEELFTVTPMDKPQKPPYVDHYEVVQEIQVYDPRTVISEDLNGPGEKVIVSRVQVQRPIYKKGVSIDPHFHLVYQKTIEVLKEYTFKEWDGGLVWEKL